MEYSEKLLTWTMPHGLVASDLQLTHVDRLQNHIALITIRMPCCVVVLPGRSSESFHESLILRGADRRETALIIDDSRPVERANADVIKAC